MANLNFRYSKDITLPRIYDIKKHQLSVSRNSQQTVKTETALPSFLQNNLFSWDVNRTYIKYERNLGARTPSRKLIGSWLIEKRLREHASCFKGRHNRGNQNAMKKLNSTLGEL